MKMRQDRLANVTGGLETRTLSVPARWGVLLVVVAGLAGPLSAAQPEILIVVGAAGESTYGQQFRLWAQQWQEAAAEAEVDCTVIGLTEEDRDHQQDSAVSDRQRWKEYLEKAGGEDVAERPLWLVLLGHGTYDGRIARFNMRGPDVTAAELAEWVGPLQRPVAVLNCTSSSAPFLPELSAPNRVILTATRSGDEQQFARLGGMLAESIADPQADLDKDQQVSLLEAIVFASRKVARFYQESGRLATEHALLDDNGDQRGTPLQWFEGVMAVAQTTTEHALDGTLTHQWQLDKSVLDERLGADGLHRRAELEQQLYDLRRRKSDFVDEDRYYHQLEQVLVHLAELYQTAEAGDPVSDAGPATSEL